ncbi:MAG: hypothetical protein V4640_08720 [Verrucomicrobiota bacterium]
MKKDFLLRVLGVATGLSAGLSVHAATLESQGFAVNNQSRNDVIAFWHAVYQASEGYENRVGWTGNYTGNPGKVSPAFTADVERRLNYFRAMCGLETHARVNTGTKVFIDPADAYKPVASTTKTAAAQDAALLLIRNYDFKTGNDPALTHFPPPNLIGWSPAAWNALAKGNLAFGLYGPGAITEYMIEKISSGSVISAWNSEVGHRRWCLYPRATDFASGDQPGESVYRPPSNTFYVIPNPAEIDAKTASGFVAFPPAGFFPASLNTPYWSLSREGADFSSARVSMTDARGQSLPISLINTVRDFGDPALVWSVNSATSINRVLNDTRFNVSITGIRGTGIPTSLNYSVTLINPDLITSNQKIKGPNKLPSSGQASFSATPPDAAEALEIAIFRKESATWKEDGESPKKARVIDRTGKNYPLMAKGGALGGFGALAGNTSFRLTFPIAYDPILRSVPEQSFELDREIIASTKATLTFSYRRGFMTRNSTLAVERSFDGGVSWQILGSPINGVSDTRYDNTPSSAKINLPKSSKPFRIRFRYFSRGGIIYTHEAAPKSPTGIFLDEIAVDRCDWLAEMRPLKLFAKTSSFTVDSRKVGAKLKPGDKLAIALRTKLGGKWFPIGPVKSVTISK